MKGAFVFACLVIYVGALYNPMPKSSLVTVSRMEQNIENGFKSAVANVTTPSPSGSSGLMDSAVVPQNWSSILNSFRDEEKSFVTIEQITRNQFWIDPIPQERLDELQKLQERENRSETLGVFRSPLELTESLSSKVTIVIKSFERTSCVVSYVRSIRKHYPTIPILLAEDSRDWKNTADRLKEDEHLTIFALPFDSGVSAGKNFLIDHVKTPFVVISDDDLLFTEHTSLEHLLADMESSGADVVGGCVDSHDTDSDCHGDLDMFYRDPILPSSETAGYSTLQLKPLEHRFMELVTQRDGSTNITHTPHCKEADMVTDFFLARTAFVSRIRWDPFFKVGGDEDFFYRAKKSQAFLRFCTSTKILHKSNSCLTKANEARYMRFWGRKQSFTNYFFVKHTPISHLELPTALADWKCECDDNPLVRDSRECNLPMVDRKDCRAVWQYASSNFRPPISSLTFNAPGSLIEDGLVYYVSPTEKSQHNNDPPVVHHANAMPRAKSETEPKLIDQSTQVAIE
eukprot:c8420_g1_i1.p1 GENE.c8420_g1_i1~~c8420_g1_i1.p1  ORF type:complete len:515 (-),score=101.18 c8420_g1_i1:371-1915(-)